MGMQLFQPFDLFTPTECQSLIDRVSTLERPTVMSGSIEGVRTNRVAWPEPAQELRDRVWELAQPWAEQFQLSWMQTPFQISHYAPGEYYGWHSDVYSEQGRKSMRSLTLTVSLRADPGAGVEFESGPCNLGSGQGVFFPSDCRHRAYNRSGSDRWAFTVWYMRRL